MNRNEIYDFAISKGCSREKAAELAIVNDGKSRHDIDELIAAAIAIPLMGAVVVDKALGGIPSAAIGTTAAIGFGILEFLLG